MQPFVLLYEILLFVFTEAHATYSNKNITDCSHRDPNEFACVAKCKVQKKTSQLIRYAVGIYSQCAHPSTLSLAKPIQWHMKS